MNKKWLTTRRMAIIGVLGGISMVLGLTPLGFIPIGPTRATIMHIPVIIGAILEGPVVGAIVGLIFGLFSIFQAVTNPTPISFVFLNPLVSVLPRILIGVVSYYVYRGFSKIGKRGALAVTGLMWLAAMAYLIRGWIGLLADGTAAALAFQSLLVALLAILGVLVWRFASKNAAEIALTGIFGTLTNTLGVLTMIYLLYGKRFAESLGADPDTAGKMIISIGLANGVPEMIVAMIVSTYVVLALMKNRGDRDGISH
jgi:uncharacterized membrane protein